MKTLEELIAATPRYRTIFPEGWDPRRPLAVFCRAGDVRAAARHFADGRRAKIFAFILPDDYWQEDYRLKMLRRAALRFLKGRKLLMLDEIDRRTPPAIVMFGEKGFEVWQSIRLAQGGFRNVMFFEDPGYGREFRYEPDFMDKYGRSLRQLFDGLQDEESRLTLASVIQHRLDGGFEWLRLAEYRQYEHPVVGAAPGDVVLDVGAEDGSDSLMFSRQVGADGRVYAFEPDPVNLDLLRPRFAARPNITTVPLALGDVEADARLVCQKGGLSHLARPGEPGGIPVRVLPADRFVEERGLARVDLIKLDTEGYEMPILAGAAGTIRRFKPKLQVSVYHKQQGRDDLADVPDLISRLEPAYRYYLGHHGSWGNETILYAKCP